MFGNVRHWCCAWMGGILSLIGTSAAAADAVRAVAGEWDHNAGNILLHDPLTHRPTAVLQDPAGRTMAGDRGILFGGIQLQPVGLSTISVSEVAPEFWAEPAAWKYSGPAAYSGFGKDAGVREWAGRPDFDRRAYALDPGWRIRSMVDMEQVHVGTVHIAPRAEAMQVRWRGLSNHVYRVEFSPSLGQPFTTVQTMESLGEQDLSVLLPVQAGQGFYRVAEEFY